MKSILFMTHENVTKTAVAKAMFYDVAEEISNSYKVTFLSAKCDNEENKLTNRNIEHIFFSRKTQGRISLIDIFLLLKSLFSISKIIKSCDIVYIRSYPMMILSYFFLIYHGKKVVFDTRGLFFEELFDSGKLPRNKILCNLFYFLEKRLLRASSVTLCVTELQRNYYQMLSLNTCYRVIYNGAKKTDKITDYKIKDGIKFCYVGSLVKWHLPERISNILFLLQSSGLKFDFHCVTKDLDVAHHVFEKINNKYIYTHNFRDNPIKFDYGFCLISDTLSKRVCFPVKYAEYLVSGTKVIFSDNVDVCKKFNNKYPSGLDIDLDSEDADIAIQIFNFIEDEREDSMSVVSLPPELEFDSMVSNIKDTLNDIVIK